MEKIAKKFYLARKCAPDTIKTGSKKAIQKTAKTGNLIGNKTVDKITKVSKISSQNNLRIENH